MFSRLFDGNGQACDLQQHVTERRPLANAYMTWSLGGNSSFALKIWRHCIYGERYVQGTEHEIEEMV
jgi:hypothetical protein